jgi:hypothetical protein
MTPPLGSVPVPIAPGNLPSSVHAAVPGGVGSTGSGRLNVVARPFIPGMSASSSMASIDLEKFSTAVSEMGLQA